MKIAITLLTCGRVDYTRRTLDTLCKMNPDLRASFVLLHGDDLATLEDANANRSAAREAGFETVLAPSIRYGVARMTELLFEQAAKRGVDAVLNLQNDWVSDRAIPVRDIEEILSDPQIYTVRMYGALKSAHGRCGIHHGGRTPRRIVQWLPHATLAGYEVGDIHWGHPPAVTRIKDALALTRAAPRESVSRERSGRIDRLTARPVTNVMSHIGAERTPEFRA